MCTRIHACVGGIGAIVTDNGQTWAFVAMRSACTVQRGILQSGHRSRGGSRRPPGLHFNPERCSLLLTHLKTTTCRTYRLHHEMCAIVSNKRPIINAVDV